MINKDNCILLGALTKPYGVKGSLSLWIKNLKADEIKGKVSVFVEIDGLLVPFNVEDILIKSQDSVVLKLEGIDSETKAREFAGFLVYIDQDQIKRKFDTIQESPNIRNYSVMDRQLGFVGLALKIIDLANNPLLVVRNGDKEYLVPVHEDLILEVNDQEKVIRIDVPDGLFDL